MVVARGAGGEEQQHCSGVEVVVRKLEQRRQCKCIPLARGLATNVKKIHELPFIDRGYSCFVFL